MKSLFGLKIIYLKLIILITVFIMNLPQLSSACASCGCTLSSDWGHLGFSTTRGFKVDLKYDYLNQDQLRSGTNSISPKAASQIVNNGHPQEVETYTKNNDLTFGIEYNLNSEMGISLQVPYIFRDHSTLGTASNGTTPGDSGGQYHSSTNNIGDLKVTFRYQSFIPALQNFGITVGGKFPTGSYTEEGNSTDTAVVGKVDIDRGLQPGTGTTDLIFGIYYFDGISIHWNYFAQALYQKALYSRNHYRPGDGINVNVGLRYSGISFLTPQLQLNTRYVNHDEGANADQVSTGGTLIYLSPGVMVPATKWTSIYTFTQIPIYQNVEGVQLTPAFTASIGLRVSF